MPIVNTKINGVTEPMGYEFAKPLLSWQVEGGAGTQKDAAIKVYTDNAATPRVGVPRRPQLGGHGFGTGYPAAPHPLYRFRGGHR